MVEIETTITVIILTVRRPRRLWQALASVGAQTYPHVEVVVVNNGGVPIDGIIARYQAAFSRPITLVTLPTAHMLGAARNVGAHTATGTLLALLDDDDRYRPDHLARLVAALGEHPEAVLAYDDALIHLEESAEDDDSARDYATCRLGLPYDQATFDQDDYILTSAIAMRRAAFAAVGGFDETLPFCEDWDLLLRLREHGALRYVPGAIGVDYSMRLAANDNTGSTFDARRHDALELLSTRYHLPPLLPKTFFDVARDLGCVIIPVTAESEEH